MTITFTVLGEPVGKARQRVTRFGTYTPQATVLYENLIKTEYRRQCHDHRFDDKQPLRLKVSAYYQIPVSASKKKRAMMLEGKIRPMKKPDLSNVIKSVEDALNKIAYCDDSRIECITAERFYSDRPRLDIQLSVLSAPREGAKSP